MRGEGMIQNILWDFDGVILDSNTVKRAAFGRLLEQHEPAAVDALLRYHDANGGLSRYHKIRYFFTGILGRPIADSEVDRLAGRFSDLVKDELRQPRYVITESVRFIRRHHRRYNFHVVSGADEAELQELCHAHHIAGCFRSIHGSPTPKVDNVRVLLERRAYRPVETILIGDSVNDLDAARENGVLFLGYNNPQLRGLPGTRYVEAFDDGLLAWFGEGR
jgi:phosphoglycolate phosphatase-like HAD superfamily hydrolase